MRYFTTRLTRNTAFYGRLIVLLGLLFGTQLLVWTVDHAEAASLAATLPFTRVSTSGFAPVVDVVQTGRNSRSSVVEGQLVFEARVFDPRVGNRNGDGIRNVVMIVLNSDDEELYRKTENDPSYCAFGGDTPCPAYDFEDNNNRWPNGDRIREDEEYRLRTLVTANNDEKVMRETTIEVRLSDSGFAPVVDVVQTGRNSRSSVVEGQLVFEARVFDPRVGNRNGDGIRNVVMIVLNSDDEELYRKTENDPSYCAFGGDTPCPAYDFADNNNRWPNGDRIREGEEYRLRTLVTADNGDKAMRETTIEVRFD